MLAICGSRDYVFFIDAAVIERFSQTGSLRNYLEEEADLGAEPGGKLRNAILTGFCSEDIMAAVRAMALVCKSSTCCRRCGRPRLPYSSRLLPRLRL
eukprot:4710260-Pleurochrysis_carterae.AAC.1